MKRFSKYLFGRFLGLSLVLSALPGHAQDSDRVNVTIPFDFVVGAKQLKAGNYVVESWLDNSVLRLRSEGGDVQQIAFTVPIETNQTVAANSPLEFKRRVLGKTGQPVIRSFLASEAHAYTSAK